MARAQPLAGGPLDFRRWSRRRFLASGIGLPLSALAQAPDEELVPFSDDDPEFRADAQADSPPRQVLRSAQLDIANDPRRRILRLSQGQNPAS